MFHLGAALLQNLAVSPELTLRPSLSGESRVSPDTLRPSLWRAVCRMGVAGANAPAFVERASLQILRSRFRLCRRS